MKKEKKRRKKRLSSFALEWIGSAGHVSTSMCSRWCSVLWSSGAFVTATPPAASPTASPAGYIRCD